MRVKKHSSLRLIYTRDIGLAFSLSDAISIEIARVNTALYCLFVGAEEKRRITLSPGSRRGCRRDRLRSRRCPSGGRRRSSRTPTGSRPQTFPGSSGPEIELKLLKNFGSERGTDR